ncbi:hexose carrier protein [Aspergillus pseudoustus]|uniref:Hexose carrier protein n=1 Tax=Aspergillus pseudoustus TaxID=1810923 RepID=A0ABR4ITK7_9EURO
MRTRRGNRSIKGDSTSMEHVEAAAGATTITEDPSLLEESISYGRGGLHGILNSGYVFGAASLASLGGISFGYDQGVISIINAEFGKGFMTGMLLLGALVGCLLMPYLVDRISRKWALAAAVVVFDTGAVIQTSAQNYGAIVAGRAIGGVGMGALAMGAPLYIAEIAPSNLRGTLLVLESVSIVSVAVISYWITFGTRFIAGETSFRLPLGLQMIPATVLGVTIHFFPYSPRWLALADCADECVASQAKLHRLPSTDPRVQAEFWGILLETTVQRALNEKRHPAITGAKLDIISWLDLLRLRVTFFQQFMGVNAFIYYALALFQSIGQTAEMSLVLSGVFNVLQLVAVLVCILLIDNLDRRPLAIFGGFGAASAYIIIAVLSALYSDNRAAHVAAGWAGVAMSFLFIIVFGAFYSSLGWALPPEVYTNTSRARGVGLATSVGWLGNFIVGISTPPMIASIGYGTYLFYAALCLLAGLWAVFLLPETRGKTLKELDKLFGDESGREERELMRATVMVAGK